MALNAQHKKFIECRLEGMSRIDAYMKAYNSTNRSSARRQVSKMLLTNHDILAELEKHREKAIAEARENLELEATEASEVIAELKRRGYASDSVKLRAAQDILDRVGLKAPEQVEHSGDINISFLDIIRERARRQEGE